MLELYPFRVLSNAQIQHILGNWERNHAARKNPNSTMHAISFRSYIPSTLHTLLVHDSARRFPSSSTVRFTYHICEIHPGAKDTAWRTNQTLGYHIPLTTDTPHHGFTKYKRHHEIGILQPGRVCVLTTDEKYKHLANNASTSRIFLSVRVVS